MTTKSDRPTRSRWLLYVLALLLGVGLALTAYVAWTRFNPFVNYEQAVQEANALRDSARRGPLNDAQFGRVMELSGPSRRPIVSLTVIAILQLEAERSPARVESARIALTELQSHPDAGVRSAATTVLSRLDPPR